MDYSRDDEWSGSHFKKDFGPDQENLSPAEAAAREHDNRVLEIDGTLADLDSLASQEGTSLGSVELGRVGEEQVKEQSSRWSRFRLAFSGGESRQAKVVKMAEKVAYENLKKLEKGLGQEVSDLKNNLAKHESRARSEINVISSLPKMDPAFVESMRIKMAEEGQTIRENKEFKEQELAVELSDYPVLEKQEKVAELITEYQGIEKDLTKRRLTLEQDARSYQRALKKISGATVASQEIAEHLNAQIEVLLEQQGQIKEREEAVKKRLVDLRADQKALQPFAKRLQALGKTPSEILDRRSAEPLARVSRGKEDREFFSRQDDLDSFPTPPAADHDREDKTENPPVKRRPGELSPGEILSESQRNPQAWDQERTAAQWVASLKRFFQKTPTFGPELLKYFLENTRRPEINGNKALDLFSTYLLDHPVDGLDSSNSSAVLDRAGEIIRQIIFGVAPEETQSEETPSADPNDRPKVSGSGEAPQSPEVSSEPASEEDEEETSRRLATAQLKNLTREKIDGMIARSHKDSEAVSAPPSPEKRGESAELNAPADVWITKISKQLADEKYDEIRPKIKTYFTMQFSKNEVISDLVARDILTKLIVDEGKTFGIRKKFMSMLRANVFDGKAAKNMANEIIQDILAGIDGLRKPGEFPEWDDLHSLSSSPQVKAAGLAADNFAQPAENTPAPELPSSQRTLENSESWGWLTEHSVQEWMERIQDIIPAKFLQLNLEERFSAKAGRQGLKGTDAVLILADYLIDNLENFGFADADHASGIAHWAIDKICTTPFSRSGRPETLQSDSASNSTPAAGAEAPVDSSAAETDGDDSAAPSRPAAPSPVAEKAAQVPTGKKAETPPAAQSEEEIKKARLKSEELEHANTIWAELMNEDGHEVSWWVDMLKEEVGEIANKIGESSKKEGSSVKSGLKFESYFKTQLGNKNISGRTAQEVMTHMIVNEKKVFHIDKMSDAKKRAFRLVEKVIESQGGRRPRQKQERR